MEKSIYSKILDRFLGVAQRLKLEGLMGNDEDTEQEVHHDYAEDTTYSKEENTMSEAPYAHAERNNKNNTKGREVTKVDKVLVPTSEDVSEVKERVKQYMEKATNGKFRCTICGKEAVGEAKNAKTNLMNHVETHLEGLSFPCQLCGKTFRSRNAFNIHKTRFHR